MKKEYKFEDYLMDKHATQFIGVKDSMPDDFNEWLENLSIDDWIEYGDKFANKMIAKELKPVEADRNCDKDWFNETC